MSNNEERKQGAIARVASSAWRATRRFGSWYIGMYKGRKWYTKTAVAMVSAIVMLEIGRAHV